jgi:DNA/RNA endonuclease G (NUC1)
MAPLIKIIAASWLLFFFNPTGELPNVTIKKQHYTSVYSQSLEQPLMVTYEVLCSSVKSKANYNSRQGLDFYVESGIHTSDNADYVHNDYDKGHMAPAADFNCDEIALKETFSYVNCTLQHKDLNRGLWKELEAYEKELAATHAVTVKIQIEFTKITRVATGAAIPTGFTKTIYLEGKPFKSYYFPNQSLVGSFEKYLVKKY